MIRPSHIHRALLCAVSVFVGATAHRAHAAPEKQPATQPVATVETVVFIRHGEKPTGSSSELTPQGLNRAIALSTLLPRKFGKPDFLFAPDPQQVVRDHPVALKHTRALETILPTAIRFDMPIYVACGTDDVAALDAELVKPAYADSTIFIAWEHTYGGRAAAGLVKLLGGNASQVPDWGDTDYDSIYLIKITRTPNSTPTVTFTIDHEGLDGQSKEMPVPAPIQSDKSAH